MKTTTLLLSAIFLNCVAMGQITQDSLNKLQEEVNKKQREINSMQRSLNKNIRAQDSSEDLIQNILNDLLDMKIISNKEVVAFSITSDKMEVNNKKQPDKVLETFKSKYHIVKGYSIAHAKTRDSAATSITK